MRHFHQMLIIQIRKLAHSRSSVFMHAYWCQSFYEIVLSFMDQSIILTRYFIPMTDYLPSHRVTMQ